MQPIRSSAARFAILAAFACGIFALRSSALGQSLHEGATVVVTAEQSELQIKDKGTTAVVKKGDKLKILKIQGVWLGVELSTPEGSRKGWIKRDEVQLEQAEPESRPRPVAKAEPEPEPEPVAKTEPEKKPEPEKRPKPEEETEPSPKTVSKGGPAKAATGEWPQWRGPNRDGVSHETGLLKKWPAEGPPKLWTAKGMGQGYASVAVANGLVYTAGNVGGETKIAAVDLDGNVRWQSGCGRAFAGQYAGSRGTPTIDGNKLYYETPNGEVSCLDARTGQKVWSVDIMQRFRGQNIGWALSESVLIDGNNVICSPGGPNAGVVALNKANGETVWACKELSDKPGYASPIVFDLQGVHQIVTMNSVAAVGIHAKTGKLLWRHEHRTNYDANIPTPIFYKGTVFIDSGYGKGGALLKLNPGDARQVWTTDLDNHHGGIVLVDEHLYGSSQNGKWMCVELRTGRTAYADGGVGKGSVTCADGMLYMLSEQGTMGLAPATPNGHTVVSRFRVPAGGSGEVWAHPVVCGGRLYIRHGDALHAFDIKAR